MWYRLRSTNDEAHGYAAPGHRDRFFTKLATELPVLRQDESHRQDDLMGRASVGAKQREKKQNMSDLTMIRARVLDDRAAYDLVDDPDCLAELEHTYSVFRFRYPWGTLFEVTFTNHADGEDRTACWALVPSPHLVIDTQDTDTTGVGHNGIVREVTHRVVAPV